MRNVPLQATANQAISITVDRNRWDITIKAAVDSMVVDLRLNDQVIVRGLRIMPNQTMIPYRYLSTVGNFMLLTVGDALPDWRRFETDQELVYATAEEIASYGG